MFDMPPPECQESFHMKRVHEPVPGLEVTTSIYSKNTVRSAGRPKLRSGMLVVREDAVQPLIGVIRNVRRDGRVTVTWFHPEVTDQRFPGDGTAELPRFNETLPADRVAALVGQVKPLDFG